MKENKFGHLGFNIIYFFNKSDLESSQTIVKNLLSDDKDEIPWDAILYLVGDIFYGGRVTDNNDRRCLNTILESFLNPAIIEEGYSYTSSGIYKLPTDGSNVESIIEYVQNLPDVDSPEIFGMNENANIACLADESSYLIETVLSIQNKTSIGSSSAQENDKFVDNIASKINEELPLILTKEGSSKELFKISKQGLFTSLTIYLLQEMERFNKLIEVVAKTIEELRAAIKGLAVMSDELDKMYNCILMNKVPDKWEEYAYPSLKPLGSWVKNLIERVEFIRTWLIQGRLLKFWMPCFFFPQGFCTSVLQEHARKYQIAIDELSFSFKLVENYEKDEGASKSGTEYIIHGLFLESGKINKDTMMLEDTEIGKNFNEAPGIKFIPTRNHTPDPLDYSCPLYKTSERQGTLNTTGNSTNFILMVEIPSSHPPGHWIKRGTALLSQLDN